MGIFEITAFNMTHLKADLHVHTWYSDGGQTPAEAVQWAREAGLQALAITDHDCMLGIPEAQACCNAYGIRLAHGCEVSAYEGDVKLHTLAYNCDETLFQPFMEMLASNSVKRTEAILAKLDKIGVHIPIEEPMAERYSPEQPIHGMHIARAGVKRGYAPDPYAFFGQYLNYGCPGYVTEFRPSPEETVEAVRSARGFSVVAHPGRIDMTPGKLKDLLIRLKALGLEGLEVYYSTHTPEQTAEYEALANELGLICTGGSDTHLRGRSRSVGKPDFWTDEELAGKLGIL
ncbi:MAG: PHP domain-containing protein [Clostridia bacterium]|nr:PHP domain-containing protein [Clostridia bacterium]